MTSSNLWSDGSALAGPVGDLFRVEVTFLDPGVQAYAFTFG